MDVCMPWACRRMWDLGAVAVIHGVVGEMIGHGVERTEMVRPTADTELVCKATDDSVETTEAQVLGRSVVAELREDQRTVTDDFKVRPRVV